MKIIFFLLVVLISGYTNAYQVSDSKPSYDCRATKYFSEIFTCESKNLIEIDNRLEKEYSFLLNLLKNNEALILSQKKWVVRKNSCTNYKCLFSIYEKRLQKIRLDLANLHKNNNSKCIDNNLEAIFTYASKKISIDTIINPVIDIYTSSNSDGEYFDFNSDGKYESSVVITGDTSTSSVCSSMNCANENDVLIKINGCYSAIIIPMNRTDLILPGNISGKARDAYLRYNFAKGISIVTTYNIMGCAGGEGIKTYYGLNPVKLKYEYFGTQRYHCSFEEGKFTTN
jgi:uncharacterized protein